MKTKEELYQEALKEIEIKINKVKGDIIPKMATVSAVLKEKLPHYLWCGFYFAEEGELVVGPYQGSVACPNIAYTGVCGTSAKKKQTLVVPDVHKFPGHIVCDTHSKSEIVVPIIDEEKRVIGVFDVDSSQTNAFDEIDKKYLEKIMPLLLKD